MPNLFGGSIYYAFTRSNKNVIKHTEIFVFTINPKSDCTYHIPIDWFGSKRKSISIQINMVSTIWFRVDLIRFRKDLSVCTSRLEKVASAVPDTSISMGTPLRVPLKPFNAICLRWSEGFDRSLMMLADASLDTFFQLKKKIELKKYYKTNIIWLLDISCSMPSL